MKDILLNELKGFYRNRVFKTLIGFFIISLFLTTYFGIMKNNKQSESQKEAQEHIREQWENKSHGNPHQSAHFGSYAFKPINVLNSIDEGINSITGNVIRLEGHTQNDVMFSEASQSLLVSKFGKMKPSLLFQFIIPLFLIFLSFNSYTQERDSGRLKLLIVQGASLKNIVFSKIISVWLIGCSLLLVTVFVQLLFNSNQLTLDVLIRLIVFVLSYGVYYFILISLTSFLSLFLKSSTGALSLTVVIWVLWVVFFPKIFGNAVEKMKPLPTRVDFQTEMTKDRSQGIDGHNPSDARREKLILSTLKEYGVSELSELPVNFRGILMQADEEYGNSVWDKHFGSLYNQLQTQKNIYQFTGIINPFASLQSLSMGAAGTDMYHHLNFLSQAEKYRRVLIKKLNNKWRDGGWNDDFFISIEDFRYNPPYFLQFLSKYVFDIVFLSFWSLILIYLINYYSKKNIVL